MPHARLPAFVIVGALLAAHPHAQQPDTAARLVERAVAAMGGAAVIDNLRSIRVEGVGTRRLATGDTVEMPTVSALLFPDSYLHEVLLPVGPVRTVIAGKDGFLMSATETAPLSDDERFNVGDRLLRLPLVLLRKRDGPFFEAISEGAGELNGRATIRLLIRIGQRKQTRLVLDASTCQILQVAYRERTPQGETGAEIVSTYSDYRVVKGLSYPFSVSVSVNGRAEFTAQTRSLVVDDGVEPGMFKPSTPIPLAPPPLTFSAHSR
jgi:hypothetical protein